MNTPALPTILHVGPVGQSRASGLATSIPGLVRALHNHGVPAGLLTTSRHKPYIAAASYPIVHIRDLPRLTALQSLPSPFNRPDLVVFHSTYVPVHALLALQCKRKGIPYIVTPRGGMTKGAQHVKRLKKTLGNLAFFDHMIRNAAAIHCLTEQEAKDVQLWRRPVFVVGNGIELPPLAKLAHPGSTPELRLVFIGRLNMYIKGLDLLINACAQTKSSLRAAQATVHLYGPGSAATRAELETLIAARDLVGLVHQHDAVYGTSKAETLHSADVFLHTSRFEGHPMAVLEALSYGIPCLLSAGTNISQRVASAGAGWHVPTDADSIAVALQDLLQQQTALPAMGVAARKLAEASYSWERVASRMLDCYESILRGEA